MCFTQGDEIRDYVFPLVEVEGSDVKRFLGTAFLIGNRGVGLTAAHVLRDSDDEQVVGLFVDRRTWFPVGVLNWEIHPVEDVAALRLEGTEWNSFMCLSNSSEGQSLHYRSFGYPVDAMYDLSRNGYAARRPDLVYSEGYVRRRLSCFLPGLVGTSFYELSAVAGSGCSGSPILKFVQPVWPVVGIYVGERRNEDGVEVGYATREESFRDWAPDIVGKRLLDESHSSSISFH